MTKTMLEWVFYWLTLVNVILVNMWNWPEHAVSESKNIGIYKRGLENTVVCHIAIENAHF